MTNIASIALSGMALAETQLQVSAHNIANLGTEPFARQEVVAQQLPGGGVAGTVVQSSAPGPQLEADIVAQLQAKNAFLANLAVFRTSNRIAGALIDASA
jgi:flagellar basal body rod protein FlgG